MIRSVVVTILYASGVRPLRYI